LSRAFLIDRTGQVLSVERLHYQNITCHLWESEYGNLKMAKIKDKTAQGKRTPTGLMPESEGSNKRIVIIMLFLFWIIGIIVIFIKWGNF
jgi:hypothetical protein